MTQLLAFSLSAWRKEPDMRMEDAYKWLFHATRGGEHAVTDDDGPRRWLDREWPTLTAQHPGERLLVPLRPDKKIVRLQLRPYRQAGGVKDKLLAAFIASARAFKAEPEEFVLVWKELGELLKRKSVEPLTFAEWQRVNQESAVWQYPAIDHSPHYEKAQKPAYRVLTDSQAQLLIASLARAAQ